MRYYAIKSIDNKEVNKIVTDWAECSQLVLKRKAVYKSFSTQEEALQFLNSAPKTVEAFTKGYSTLENDASLFYGKYVFTRYSNEDNGFTIAIYQTSKGERVCCKGYFLPTNKRLTYCFGGRVNIDKKYGKEFIVESFKAHISNTKESIVAYLSNSGIKGIGQKTAERIWEKFHSDSIKIIEEEPEKLAFVKGISKKKALKIAESYKEKVGAREITMFLQKYGISPKYAMKVFSIYKGESVTKIMENPYLLMKIRGLTFEDADNIALSLKLPFDSKERIKAAILSAITDHTSITGDTCVEQNKLGSTVVKKLTKAKVPTDIICSMVCDMIKEGSLKVSVMEENGERKKYISSNYFYQMEKDLALDFSKLLNQNTYNDKNKVLDLIEKGERKFNITLDVIQKEAVLMAITSPLTVITGGPGTGKTTICKIIDYVYSSLFPKNDEIFLAPTGRAARHMTESIGKEAHTIHSKLRIGQDISLVPSEDDVLIENSLVLLDEFSMADTVVAHELFKASSTGNTLVLMGDVDQLPSVSPGAVLRDIINSNLVPVIRLEKVYRQDKDTQLYSNILKIKKGDTDIHEAKDFHLHECGEMEDVRNLLLNIYKQRVAEYGVENVMCICPYIKYTAGVEDMNALLQSEINPPSASKKELSFHGEIFREGDMVMNLKNNRDKDVANGDYGVVKSVFLGNDEDDPFILVNFDGKEIEYDKNNHEELRLAYATTVHKSQGSEAKAVVFAYSNFHKGMLYRSIPYVAISRAREVVDICGSKTALNNAITTIRSNERKTLLELFLNKINGKFVPAA